MKQLESLGGQAWEKLEGTGFPTFGLPTFALVLIGIALFVVFVLYSLTAKSAGGRDSHAGREQTRRAYRNALARYMAKEDAEKIRKGEKVRRRWMQW